MLIRLADGERILLEGAARGWVRPVDATTYATDLDVLLKLRLLREEEGQFRLTVLGKLVLKWSGDG